MQVNIVNLIFKTNDMPEGEIVEKIFVAKIIFKQSGEKTLRMFDKLKQTLIM